MPAQNTGGHAGSEHPSATGASTAGLVPRARVRRLRRRLRTTGDRLDRAQAMLAAIGAWSLDVFPDVRVPDGVEQVISAVRDQRLTYLTAAHLRSLAQCVAEVEQQRREGILVEAGTARGGSAIVMAAAKSADRELRVYDVFDTIPPPGERDGADVHRRYAQIRSGESRGLGGDTYYGYRADLLAEVTASFRRLGLETGRHRVSLVRGRFEDTLDLDDPVALAHVDGDWYESTRTCLERIAPLLVPGGRIVVDDYWMWTGCRDAVDEYVAGRPRYRLEMREKVHLVRRS